MRDKRDSVDLLHKHTHSLAHGSHVLAPIFSVFVLSFFTANSVTVFSNEFLSCVCAAFGSNLFPFKYLPLTLNTMRRVYLEMPSQLSRQAFSTAESSIIQSDFHRAHVNHATILIGMGCTPIDVHFILTYPLYVDMVCTDATSVQPPK